MELGYALHNAHEATVARFTALAELFDRHSIENLSAAGIKPDWTCLDVGAGGGSIATWLCGEVGREGQVTATDIDTRFLDRLAYPNLHVRRHDINSDALPVAAFDLVHSRLLLVVISQRERPLEKMLAALKPGGWLVAEEFDSVSLPLDPTPSSAEIKLKSVIAVQKLMTLSGANLQFGRRLGGWLRDHGCVDVKAEGHVSIWHGNSTGARLLAANVIQLRDEMIKHELIDACEVESDLARLADPTTSFLSPMIWSVRARRPAT